MSHVSVTAIVLRDFEYTNDWNCSSLLTTLVALVYTIVSQLESDAGLSEFTAVDFNVFFNT